MTTLSAEILSDITVFTKYAKHLPMKNRRETFSEIIDRNMEMHLDKFKKNTELCLEIRSVYSEFVKTKKILPSMRSLQFGGKPIELSPNRVYNCCFLPIDDLHAFSESMFLLLGGTGVGYSVQKNHVEKLPEIRKPTKSRRFLIGDSIEGWADAVKVLMQAYMIGKTLPRFDYSDIREKGAQLVTSGGKAPGPEPLKDCLHNIKKILDRKKDGEQLTTLEVHDIMCYIADAVLAGGIRRAALICLFDMNDEDMLTCKFGNWWELNPQRGRSNNSAVILRHKIKKKDFMKLWDKIKASGSGEPGFYLTNNAEWGTNPCCEIALRPFQFCVSAETKLITRNGISKIKDITEKEVEIWNGEEWSTVKPYQTGTEDVLHRVKFSDGSFLDATNNHKFLVKNRFETEFREVETLDLIKELRSSKYGLQIPRSNIKYTGGTAEENAYDYGFVLGDGCVHGNYVEAGLFGLDKLLEFKTVKTIGDYKNSNDTEFRQVRFSLNIECCRELKYSNGLPSRLFTYNKESILNFIAGWADADGSQASKGIRIYGREDKIRDGQLLLSKIGINSSVNLMSKKGERTNLGERKNDVWYLQITKTIEIPCQRLSCNNTEEALCKGQMQLIKSIETLEGVHSSYCLTEEKLHQCVFNNVLTKQCNLCEVNMGTIKSQEDLDARARAASFIGTLQASYTDFHYLRDIWKKTTERDALIGVSGTGIASGKYKDLDLKKSAGEVVKENIRIADVLGINAAARTTCVKPAGTSSMVLGTSSGIHGWHNDYYIRRMRLGKDEAIYRHLAEHHSELIEDEFFKPKTQAVVSIPIEAPKGAIYRQETPLELLSRIKHFSQEWISTGHIKGDNTHNVSATVSLKDEEWEDVGKWMWDNREYYNGLSVLPYDGGSYIQAPFEDISRQKYHAMLKHITEIDLTKVIEIEDNTDLSGEIACGGGGASCEVTF